jgi:hypothetical protein
MRSMKGLFLGTIPPVRERCLHSGFSRHACSQQEFSIAHPASEDLEEYYFGRGDWPQRQTVESHLAQCDSCTSQLEDLGEFITVLSQAIQKL